MAIFLDSGDLKQVRRFMKMGVIRGVTTNPTILCKDGCRGGMKGLKKLETEIASLIKPFPLSVEVTSNDKKEMLDQAIEFSGWAENIVIKIPVHGPEGESVNMEVIHQLESRHDVRVNVTALMSAQQGLLAALAGASYVSIFGGRVNDMGHDCAEEIGKLRDLLDVFELKAKIIVGSTREISNVVEWLDAGAHFVTVVPRLLEGMLVHPYTKETVRMFLADARKLKIKR